MGEIEVELIAGWDRPLGYFFLDVLSPVDVQPDEEEEPYLYCSMNDPRLIGKGRGDPNAPFGGLSLEELQQRLSELCIQLPDTLLETLTRDRDGAVEPYAKRWG